MGRDLSIYESVTEQDYDAVAGPDWPSYNKFKTHQQIQEFVYNEIDAMLWNLKPFEHPNFCVLPFYGMEYPLNTVCCLLPQKYDLVQIQTDMLEGRRTPACQKCWTAEDAGLKSDRIGKNEALDWCSGTDLQTLFDRCVAGENSVLHYKIDTSNICNATCVTCGSFSSSAWAQLERKNHKTPQKYWSLRVDEFSDKINYATATNIVFRGGEPLLSDTNFEILEKLLEKNNTDCFISFTTNGSVTPSSDQKKLISKFKNISFGFSLDGIGPVFEYLRFPLKWDKILENITYCRNNNIAVSVNHTISNMNAYYYNESTSWFNDNRINFTCNFVEYPSWFRVAALSEDIKNTIINQHRATDLNFALQHHAPRDQYDYERFKKEIAKQDRWKGINMQDYLPDFAKLIS